jgi:hypothetical protein
MIVTHQNYGSENWRAIYKKHCIQKFTSSAFHFTLMNTFKYQLHLRVCDLIEIVIYLTFHNIFNIAVTQYFWLDDKWFWRYVKVFLNYQICSSGNRRACVQPWRWSAFSTPSTPAIQQTTGPSSSQVNTNLYFLRIWLFPLGTITMILTQKYVENKKKVHRTQWISRLVDWLLAFE